MDRISDLEISNSSFKPEKIDIENYFKNSFGIIYGENEEVEEIVLSFDSEQGQYIKKRFSNASFPKGFN